MIVSDWGPVEKTFTKYPWLSPMEGWGEKELFLRFPGTF